MRTFVRMLNSSIGKKQIVAVTGLFLIFFVVGHLAGNLFIFFGPEAFNGYAKKLAGLRPGLYLVEAALAVAFFIHIWMTIIIVIENRLARPIKYEMSRSMGRRSLATRLMPFTGVAIIVFVIWHLIDFTFVDHHGPLSVLVDGQSYGLYGVVYNAFSDPVHSAFYIVAMVAVGFHLSHAIQSVLQTFGFNHPKYTVKVERFSNVAGFLVAGVFSSIPACVLLGIL